MLKKITIGLLIALVLAAGVYWFIYTKKAHAHISEGINAIPSSAAVIFESKQAKNTWRKLSQTNIMWEELLGTNAFARLNTQGKFIDSVIELNPDISTLLDEHSVFISIHASKTDFDLLYTYSMPNLTYQSAIEDFLKKINNNTQPAEYDFEGAEISTFSTRSKNSLNFTFLDGILIMSMNQNLVEAAIQQVKSGISLAKDKNFSAVINSAGKNVDANIYINYKNFPPLLNNFIFPTVKTQTDALTDFADCSGWDITIKPNALMLSGFTKSNDSSGHFLNLFEKQKPQEIELPGIIPARTATMLFLGISNINTFHADYKNYLNLKKRAMYYNNYINEINTKYNIAIEPAIYGWINNEIALVITEPETTDYIENSYAVIHSNNIGNAMHTLNNVVDSIAKKDKEKTDTTGFRGHVICQLKLPSLLPQLLGWQFNKITGDYYTAVGDYIVFGNSVNALHNFINDYENGKTLSKDKNYKAFSENISEEANIYLYSSIARSINIYCNFVTEETAKEMNLKKEMFRKFEAVGVQFASGNKLFYSNMYLKYNPEYKQETGTLWETRLDSTISVKPLLVINHNTQAKEVVVQDDGNKIYLISNTGKILWTKQLHEKMMSDIIQLDVLKNNKLQMVFNTRSYIYMFDRNGNDMKGFPIKLRSPATNGISITDYDKNREYRIFIATENKRIVCYKANGEQLTAFKFDKTNDIVYLPLQYFNINDKDHLCAIDVKGGIYILDRQGEIRIKMKELMAGGIRNFFIETGKDYSKSYIVAADTLGNIIKVSLTSDKENFKIQDFETSPYFDYKDINNDKTKEYIFLSRTELKVFAQDKSLLFKYDFKNPISQPPLFFLFPDGNAKIGVVSETDNELYLFNNNGSLYNGFPLNGKTSFSIGDLNHEGIYNLVTGSSDHSIYVYQLQ